MGALTSASATTLAKLIAGGEVSAREVVEAHLRRIEAVNPRVNAVVQLDAERALAAADAADARSEPLRPAARRAVHRQGQHRGRRHRDGDRRPGARGRDPGGRRDGGRADQARPARSCSARRTAPSTAAASRPTTPSTAARRTRTTSSARRAAAAAARPRSSRRSGSPCGIGTDSGASVRLPAHFCGLAAIKPSAGRVPLTGVLDDEGQLGTLGDPRTQVGPLARGVEDVALLLRIVAGPDGRDGGVAPVALGGAVELRGMRVAVQTDNGLADPTPETIAAVAAAAEALRAAGAAVEPARHPDGGHELTIEVWRSYGEGVAAAELWRLLRRWDAFRGRDARLRGALRRPALPGLPGPRAPPRHHERAGERSIRRAGRRRTA